METAHACLPGGVAQRDHHRGVREGLAVQDHGHEVLTGQVPLLELAELRRASLDETTGHPRSQHADRARNRLGRGLIVAAGDPIQHTHQEQVVHPTDAALRA